MIKSELVQLIANRNPHLFLRDVENIVNAIFEEITGRGRRFIQAQAYIPAVAVTGDKRLLLIDGQPVPHALVRTPAKGEARANMAAGGKASGADLTERDHWPPAPSALQSLHVHGRAAPR